ncbi:LysR family transcriptional regulator [Streptomyces canus]|uniref:LysR family transcriptional regulator n=1 Tax=Streptomyces canus TaxID=58343 RepID=UPI0033AD29CE
MPADLNLLVALDALLQERNVTRAAQRLGLSQPTLSTALARLRRHFDDELLTRTGNSYELTPLAERLRETTEHALFWTERVFQTQPDFVPADCQREFTVVLSDAQLPFAKVFADLVRQQAPDARLRFQHSTDMFTRQAVEYLRTVDLLVLPHGLLTDMPTLDLYRDRVVCVVSADAVPDKDRIRVELASRPWVFPYRHPSPVFSPVRRLQAEGIEPRVEITTEDLLSVPYLVAGTDRIGLLSERVTRLHHAAAADVAVVDLPFEIGVLVESLRWHPVHERDPAHAWLRQTAAEAGRMIDTAADGLVARDRAVREAEEQATTSP